ncbi:helix-turn-helix transcriptional regulator [Nocardia farcinica]|uniref:helix-turn-helix domain-containing protein n=1 Tax=Nocardia farcinica TaxID=37329 RepID=UPI000DFFB5D6|nr:helix-turn-helix transcriptional regulator [Nocardia farcinica]MBF6253642.1 helix-turn-helix transcriptional regulator [Nocardia farcinica]MBF6265801.1 helix-turn-helix transcriptional regulator [Nocardia farcinica]MBF6284276.1 helix-turn-helix transcriptional regulator [Nocardia farcinica]MBF6308848.1 helix-turn-helix transcriptional regulator [Nocardia farcinica]MBF6393716.1 helix-turn-helix transcriptional regulator [Nocardia farcinica]
MGTISNNMKTRREAIGQTKAGLARILGTSDKQISRWEDGTAPPAEMLVAIAAALNFSVSELLGIAPTGLDLSGKWHAVWETSRDGIPTLNRHELEARHSGEFVYLHADGDYDWIADFRLSGSVLMGTYRAVDESRQEMGAMFLTLNHHGSNAAIGHWAGQWADGIAGSGYGVIARDPERADRLMKLLKDRPEGLIRDWPMEDVG